MHDFELYENRKIMKPLIFVKDVHQIGNAIIIIFLRG